MTQHALSSPVRALLPALLLIAFFAPGTQAQGVADLMVSKTGPSQAAADTDVTYSITVTNGGPDSATSVTLQDSTPAQMTFTSEIHDPAFSCSTPSAGGTGTVTCTAPTLAPGASANFTFVFHIDPGAQPGTQFTNVATVTEPTDPNDENNSSTWITSTPPPPSSDLGVTKTGPSATGPNTDVAYTITFFNAGPDSAATATLTDTLPGTMTFVSLSQSGTPLNCSGLTAGSGGTLTCTASPFPAGSLTTLTLTGHVPSSTASGTTYTNTATVSGGNDSNSENDVAVTQLIVSNTDVGVTKSGPASVAAASNATYTINVTNSGPDTATNVTLTDALPAGTTFVSLTQDNGPVASCGTPSPGSNGSVICTWGTLANGASAQFTLVLNSGTAVNIANTASIGTESYDNNTGNNSSTANTAVTQSADLSVTKSGPATMTAGTNPTYTIGVSNAGPSNATSVQLTDTLPANTTFVSITQTSGPVFSCTTGAIVTCTIATLAPAASATFDLVVAVSPAAASGSTISNTAGVTSAVSDPTPGNNTATWNATVATSADVTVTKNGPSAVAPGADITYTVSVSNSGPSDAAAVQLTDTVPAGTTFVSGTQTSGPLFSCTYPSVGSTGTISCTIASLARGTTAVFTFVFHVAPATTGSVSNTAVVTSSTTDPNPGNGSATTAPALVTPATTDLSITKSVNGTRFPTNANATYTIVATNNGPAVATNVVVTDVLPAGTTFVSATPSQGTCSGTTTVTCNAGVLLSGASVTITLVVTTPPVYGAVISNTATVSSDNADSNPANNAATASFAVASEIPSLSPLALALLALALAGVSLLVLKR